MQEKHRLVELLMIMLIIGLFTPLFAQGRDVVISNSPNQLRLQNNSDYGFDLRIAVEKFHLQTVDTKGGSFDEISIEGYGHSGRVAKPNCREQQNHRCALGRGSTLRNPGSGKDDTQRKRIVESRAASFPRKLRSQNPRIMPASLLRRTLPFMRATN
ncbi:MAG: hypothetical protein LRZ88_02690 [Candidatus Cloacimonetes bacterium]|nr:hypothetical protein [Candidatus Cloacimonadota bacterium]